MKSLFKSAFNRKERFGINNAPQRFESVTLESLKDASRKSKIYIAQNYPKYPPQSLETILESQKNEFAEAYTLLEGDYSTRKMNLEATFNYGYAQVQGQLMQFMLDIESHNQAYEQYLYYTEKLSGYRPSNNLRINPEIAQEFEITLNEIGSKEETFRKKHHES